MAVTERDLERSPTPSTSLLPVGGAHRKLNGQCVLSASDDDVAETSFMATGRDKDAPVSSLGASALSFDNHCVPTTSRVSNDLEMMRSSGAAAASNRLNMFYLDTKGADDDNSVSVAARHTGQHGSCREAGTRTPTSLFTADGRATYVRVADNRNLPPEVEQLRRDCVTSTSSSSDAHAASGKFLLWEFVACSVVLSLIVPCCGIPAMIFAVRSQVFYRQGDITASRAANLTALRLITVGGVCLCVLAVTASVLIAVFSYDDRSHTQLIDSTTHQRPRGMSLSSTTFEKALQRHAQEAVNRQSAAQNGSARQPGGLRSMIIETGQAQFSGRRSTVRTTAEPPVQSGLMRRIHTWNG